MANTQGDIRFRVGLQTDQQSFNKLKESLQALQKIKPGNFEGSRQELTKVKDLAKQVETALNNAFNPQLGTINISSFNNELGLSRKKVDQIYTTFSKAGAQGKVAFNQMATSVLTTNLKLKETHSLLNDMGTTMMNTIKWGIASSVMNTFTGSVQQAFQYVKSLQNSLTDIRIVTGDSTEQMERFAQSANKAAQELGRSTLDYTKSSLTFYQQGLDDETVQARTQAVLKAQNITGTGSEMADYLTSVWNGYKVANEEAELYVDKLAAVADSSASNMSQLAIAMSKVASTANIMGVDVDQLTAQIATVVATTRQAPESVGTAFKTIYARLNDIKTGADDAQISLGNYSGKMASLGINVLDANGKLRDTGQVMEEIGSKWATMTREQQMYLAATMGGQRQITQVTALFDNWGKYTDLLNISLGSQGTLVEKNSRYMESLGAKMEQLGAAGERVKSSLIDTDDVKGLIGGLTQIVNLVANFTESFGGGTNALLAFAGVATQLFSGTISTEINKFVVNLQNAKSNAEQLAQVSQNIELFGQSKGYEQEVITHLIDATTKAQQYKDVMTQAQHQEYDGYVKNIAEAQQHLLVLTEEREKAQQFLDVFAHSKHLSLKNPQILNETLGSVGIRLDELQNKLKKFDYSSFDTGRDAVQSIEEEFKKFQKVLGDTPTKALNHYDNFIEQLRKIKAQAHPASYQVEALKNSLVNLTKEANINIHIAENFDETNEKIKEQTSLLISNKNAADEFLASIEQSATIERFVKLTGSIGQAASALRSLASIPSVWTNENLSGGQKMLQTIMSISYSIPSLINGYTKLAQITGTLSENLLNYGKIADARSKIEQALALKRQAAEKRRIAAELIAKEKQRQINEVNAIYEQLFTEMKEKGAKASELQALALEKEGLVKEISTGATLEGTAAQVADTAAKQADTVATGKLTVAQGLLNKAFLANPIVLGIAAVVAAIAIGIKVYDAFNMSLEQASQAIDKFNEKQQEANNNINQYNQDKSSLKSAKEEWEELSKKAGVYNSTINRLTEEEKQRYYELSNLIAKNNSSAIASYDEQGNAIIKNNEALKETIDLLEIKKQKEIDSLYSGKDYQDAQRAQIKEKDDAEMKLSSSALRFSKNIGDYGSLFNSNYREKLSEEQKETLKELNSMATEIANGNFNNAAKFREQVKLFYQDLEQQGIILSQNYKDILESIENHTENYLEKGTAKTDDIIGKLSTTAEKEKYQQGKNLGIVGYESLVRGYIDAQSYGNVSEAINDLNQDGGFLDLVNAALGDNAIAEAAEKFNEKASFNSIKDKQEQVKNELTTILNNGSEELKALFIQASKNETLAKILENYFAQLYGLEDLDLTFTENGDAIFESFNSSVQDGLESLKEKVYNNTQGKYVIDIETVLNPNLTEDQLDAITKSFDKWLLKTNDVNLALKLAQKEVLTLGQLSDNISGINLASKVNTGETLSDDQQAAFTKGLESLQSTFPRLHNEIEVLKDTALAGTEVYNESLNKVKDNLMQNLQFLRVTGTEQQVIDAQAVSMIQTLDDLKDLQRVVSDDAYIQSLQNLASQYTNCKDELSKYMQALANGNVEEIKASQLAMELSIHSGELAKQYGYEAEQIEALAKQRQRENKDLKENSIAAADFALAELRAGDALDDIRDHFDNYLDLLKKAGEGKLTDILGDPDDFKAFRTIRKDLAGLLNISEDLIGDDWMAKNWEKVSKAISGNADALNDLDAEFAAASINDISNYIDDTALQNLLGDFDTLYQKIQKIPVGEITGDNAQFLQSLADAMYAAGMSADQIQRRFADANISCNVTPVLDSMQTVKNVAADIGQSVISSLGFNATTSTQTQEIEDTQEASGFETYPAGKDSYSIHIPSVRTSTIGDIPVPQFTGDNAGANMEIETWGVRPIPSQTTDRKAITATAVKVENPIMGNAAGGNIANKTLPTTKKKGGGGGGKGKKGSSKKASKKTAAVKNPYDRYHDVNKAIAKTSSDLDKIRQKQKELTGKDLLDNLNKQSDILEQQVKLYKQKQEIQQGEKKELQDLILSQYQALTNLSNINFLDNGNISDYKTFMDSLTKAMNAKIKWYDANQEGRKDEYQKYKEAYEEILKNFERYEELIDEQMPDLMDQIKQAMDAQLQIELTKFKLRVDIQLDLSEAQRNFNEFKKKVIDKIADDDVFGNAKANFLDLTSYYKEGLDVIDALRDQLNGTMKELQIMDAGGYSNVYGTDRVKALEDLKEYRESLMDNLSDIQDLVDDIKDSVFDMIDATDEAFEKQLDGYEYIADLISHDMSLINLYYGDDAYKEVEKYYDRQTQNDRERLDFLRQQNNLWLERMQAEQRVMDSITDKNSEAYKDAEKRFEAYKEQWEKGIEDLNDSLQNALQNIIDKYVNAINIVFQNLDNNITSGKGFDVLEEEWKLIGDYSDKYLDQINSMYEIEKLQNAYQEAINNNINNINAQKSLNNMMREQLAYLRDKDRLSQYDVDRANALLEVEVKRLALEQARNSKTKLRLRRDSQGNYTYQYTADENDVAQAEKDLADARNRLYNLTKEAYVNNLDDMYNYYSNWRKRVQEIFEDTTLSAQQRQNQLKTVTDGYSKLIERLISDNDELKNFLGGDAFEELTHYGTNPFQSISDLMPELSSYVDEFGSGLQGMADTIVSSGGFSNIASQLYDALANEFNKFNTDTANLQIDFNGLVSGNDAVLETEQALIKNKQDLIQLYKDQIDAVRALIEQTQKYLDLMEPSANTAVNAVGSSYLYERTDNENAATAAPNPVSGRPDATAAEQAAVQAKALENYNKLIEEYENRTASLNEYMSKILTDYTNVATDPYLFAASLSPISASTGSAGSSTQSGTSPAAAPSILPPTLDSSALVNQVVSTLQSIQADVDLKNVLSTLGLNGVMVGGTIDQNVHVEVNFPNVTDHFEIEKAFDNIINMASQYAYRD